MRVLEMAAVPLEAIDLLAVAAGPGSFTGLRVGIAAMQGLAMATNRKIVPVSALDALAAAGRYPDADASGTVAAWIDAQRGQVFASLYDATGVRALREPSSLAPMQTLDAWGHALAGGTVRFIGDGAARYEAVIRERLGPARANPLDPTTRRHRRQARGGRARERAAASRDRADLHPEAGRRARPVPAGRVTLMNPAGMVIERVSDPADLDAVARLEAATFTNPWTREMLDRELRQSDVARVYVVRLPGYRVAAFCACWLVYDELHINTIAVDASLRRQGLATALMRHLLADAAASGARRTFLEVRRSNLAAQQLYESLGFSVATVRRNYYTQPDEDALVLARERP